MTMGTTGEATEQYMLASDCYQTHFRFHEQRRSKPYFLLWLQDYTLESYMLLAEVR